MKVICQLVIVILLVLGFFKSMWENFEGRSAKPPWGFGGAVIDVVGTALIIALYFYAGAFSELWK